MKKFIALVAVASMLVALPVAAASSPTAAREASVSTVAAAAAEVGMTEGEYRNNAVVSTPALPNAYPVAQGGHVIINGAPSNLTITLRKASTAEINSAKANLAGEVITALKTSCPVKFDSAVSNYYVKGVQAGKVYKAYVLVNGVWVEQQITEIRADHLVVDQKNMGTLVFVAL